MRMTAVTPEALAAMNDQGARCAAELADANCDALAYACLVAVTAAGSRAHLATEQRLRPLASPDRRAPLVASAGALAAAIGSLGATRVALIAPYAQPLTMRVVDYLADLGITVVDAVSLGVTDNRAVGALDPMNLVDASAGTSSRPATNLRAQPPKDRGRRLAVLGRCCRDHPFPDNAHRCSSRLGASTDPRPSISATTFAPGRNTTEAVRPPESTPLPAERRSPRAASVLINQATATGGSPTTAPPAAC
jgi:hypothetical protein